MNQALLTRAEELILLAVWRLQADAYGVPIRKHLSKVTGREWAIGSVYVPLERLTRRGFVRTSQGPSTPERGGRSKRFYRLTPKGVAALNEVRRIQDVMWTGLPQIAFDT